MINSNLRGIARFYLDNLIPIVRDTSRRLVPYIYFVDASILNDDFSDLFSDSLWTWHIETTSWIGDWRRAVRRRLIRRFIPILRREYSENEQRLIKFLIHIQLSLGIEVVLYFTDRKTFLLDMFQSDNTAVVKGNVIIDMIDPYSAESADSITIEKRRASVSDRFSTMEDLANDPDRACILRYPSHTFTNSRNRIPEPFKFALYNLQDGRCSINGGRLDLAGCHVDHIIPLNIGGNNSLVNLQLCDPLNNIKKGIEISYPRYCLSSEEMIELGFDTIFHERFADRMLKGIRPNPDALYRQN